MSLFKLFNFRLYIVFVKRYTAAARVRGSCAMGNPLAERAGTQVKEKDITMHRAKLTAAETFEDTCNAWLCGSLCSVLCTARREERRWVC